MNRNKKSMIMLVVSALTVGIVFSASLLIMNTANAQIYNNSTTEQPQQQQQYEVLETFDEFKAYTDQMPNDTSSNLTKDEETIRNTNNVLKLLGLPQSPKYANLDVENYTGYQKGDYFYIIGQVINKDTVPYEFIEISFELYDNNSNFIGTSSTYADSDVLYPNQTTTFKGMIGDTDVSTSVYDIAKYSVSVSGRVNNDP